MADTPPALRPAFEPRVPLVLAERHVDYDEILNHILTRRPIVERHASPVARRLAWASVHETVHPQGLIDDLAERLERTLMTTARFGYRHARHELESLRAQHRRPPLRKTPATVTAVYRVPDAGKHALIALGGLEAIHRLVHGRARATANAVAEAAAHAAANRPLGETVIAPPAIRLAAAVTAATKILHGYVLELVGETLNLGRTAGILSVDEPPQYAMRSEQLDANTCDPCGELHGEIVQIDTPDYYELMPPNGCDGGGRCRGVYVFGDEPMQMEQAA